MNIEQSLIRVSAITLSEGTISSLFQSINSYFQASFVVRCDTASAFPNSKNTIPHIHYNFER